jgi:hypothetical protein
MQEITQQESKDICGGSNDIGGIGWMSIFCPLAYVICAGAYKNPNPDQWC